MKWDVRALETREERVGGTKGSRVQDEEGYMVQGLRFSSRDKLLQNEKREVYRMQGFHNMEGF